MEKLSGDYIAGFVDGEGCFALKFRRDIRRERKNIPIYFYWDIEFAIVLRADDSNILERIRMTLNCGNISTTKRGQCRYSVNKIDDLSNKIIPFFINYPLQAKKANDFGLWKEAAEIFDRTQRKILNRIPGARGFSKTLWNPEDLRRLLEIHEEMKIYKSHMPNEWKWLGNAMAG